MRVLEQVPVAVHEAEGEVFNRNQVNGGRQSGCDLVQIIRPLVANVLLQARNLATGFPLAAAAFCMPAVRQAAHGNLTCKECVQVLNE